MYREMEKPSAREQAVINDQTEFDESIPAQRAKDAPGVFMCKAHQTEGDL